MSIGTSEAPLYTDKELLLLTCQAATMSPDPSTQNGAVLVGRDGIPILATLAYNAFPRNVAYTDERWERPLKYAFIEHAERNCVYQAARCGIATEGCSLVCPWAPCADCARAIIGAGIISLVRLSPDPSSRWDASIETGLTMLAEACVEVVDVVGPVGNAPPLRRNEVVVVL